MGRRSVQLNIRATPAVVDAFRDEAHARNLSLGDCLAALLTLSQAGRDRGVWLSLPSETETALRAVAAARRVEPGAILAEFVAGNLAAELRKLATVTGKHAPARVDHEDDTGGDDDEDEVGIFTVFD